MKELLLLTLDNHHQILLAATLHLDRPRQIRLGVLWPAVRDVKQLQVVSWHVEALVQEELGPSQDLLDFGFRVGKVEKGITGFLSKLLVRWRTVLKGATDGWSF